MKHEATLDALKKLNKNNKIKTKFNIFFSRISLIITLTTINILNTYNKTIDTVYLYFPFIKKKKNHSVVIFKNKF